MKRLIVLLMLTIPSSAQTWGFYNGAPVARASFLSPADCVHAQTGVNLLRDSSLVGWWPMSCATGSVARDMSGKGNNGTWGGTKSGTNGYYSQGKTGPYAGKFDGSSTYVTTGTASLPLGNNSRTMSAWVYYTGSASYPAYYSIASYGNAGTYYQSSTLLITQTAGKLQFDVYGCGQASSYVVTPNVWHSVALAYTAGSLTYTAVMDGSSQTVNLASSSCKPNTVLASTNPSMIGVANNNQGSYFPGRIADVRIYNRALSAGELLAIYNAENR